MADLNVSEILREAEEVLSANEVPDPAEGVPAAEVGPAVNPPPISPATRFSIKPPEIIRQEMEAAAEQSRKAINYLRRATPLGENTADFVARYPEGRSGWTPGAMLARAGAWLFGILSIFPQPLFTGSGSLPAGRKTINEKVF